MTLLSFSLSPVCFSALPTQLVTSTILCPFRHARFSDEILDFYLQLVVLCNTLVYFWILFYFFIFFFFFYFSSFVGWPCWTIILSAIHTWKPCTRALPRLWEKEAGILQVSQTFDERLIRDTCGANLLYANACGCYHAIAHPHSLNGHKFLLRKTPFPQQKHKLFSSRCAEAFGSSRAETTDLCYVLRIFHRTC